MSENEFVTGEVMTADTQIALAALGIGVTCKNDELQVCVSNKIAKLVSEGYDREQAAAIAYSVCRRKLGISKDGDQQALHDQQMLRSKKYGIQILPETSLTHPADGPTDDQDYGDPVNYRYPINDVEHARNERARFKQFADAYTDEASRNAVHERIVSAEIRLGGSPTIGADALDQALPTAIKDQLKKEFLIAGGTSSSHIVKQDAEQQFVLGVVWEPDTVDTQNDMISEVEIEKTAHQYLVDSRAVGYRHKGMAKADVVESYIARSDMMLEGQAIKKGSWLIGVVVKDAALWEQVKKGEINAFSPGGYGLRTNKD